MDSQQSNFSAGPTPAPSSASNGLGVAGFVCALCALVLFWLPVVNFILWVLGIIFSAIGLNRANAHGAPYKGLSIAGLIITIVPGTVLVFVVFLLVIAAA